MLICRPLKLAEPPVAATEVVPAAKLPEDRATWMVSVKPGPLVIGLPNWSSTVTPRAAPPPAVIVAGWAVMASLLSPPAFTVNELVVAVATPPLEVSDAVIV